MKDANTMSVINAFLHGYVTHFGVPSIAITDRGVQFQFSMRSQLMTFLACVSARLASMHNVIGLLKISIACLKNAMRVQTNPGNWYYNFPLVLLTVHNIFKSDTGCSLAELTFGQCMSLLGEFGKRGTASFLFYSMISSHNSRAFYF